MLRLLEEANEYQKGTKKWTNNIHTFLSLRDL